MAHKPAKRVLDDPPARQDLEPGGVIRAFDYFDFQFEPMGAYPLVESFARVAASHPEFAPPRDPVANPFKRLLRATRSGQSNGVTTTPSTNPSVSTKMCRLRPLIFVKAS